jgi:hypothetical protein
MTSSLLMKAAYYVHGAIAPCLPVAISPESKQTIRQWIARVDDVLDNVMEVPMLIPGSEELVSRSVSKKKCN